MNAVRLLCSVLVAVSLFACASSDYARQNESPEWRNGRSRGGDSGTAVASPAPAMADEEVAYPEQDGSWFGGASDDRNFDAPPPAPPGSSAGGPVERAPTKMSAPTSKPEPAKDPGNSQAPEARSAQRIIIYVADVGVMVLHIDECIEKIVVATKQLGGWIQQSTSTSLTIRVPADNFEKLIDIIAALGELGYKNVVGTDVTEEFFDLTIRLRNAIALRDRYVELLARATAVKDALAIERELGRITDEIERFKGRLKFLQSLASNSTIRVALSQKVEQRVVHRIPLPFGWLQSYSLANAFY